MLKILITELPSFFPPLVGMYLIGKKIPLLNQSKGQYCREAYFDFRDPETGEIDPYALHVVSTYDGLKVLCSGEKTPWMIKEWMYYSGNFFIENNFLEIEKVNRLCPKFGKIYTAETRGEPSARWLFEAHTCKVIEEEWYSYNF